MATSTHQVSEYVAWSTVEYYQKIIHDILRACGHSPDLVQFVIGYADAGDEIVRNVDKVTFIGSPAVGKIVCVPIACVCVCVCVGPHIFVVCNTCVELIIRSAVGLCV